MNSLPHQDLGPASRNADDRCSRFEQICFLKFRKFSIAVELLLVNPETTIYCSPKLQ
jgi:hypothetical protein